MGGERGRRWWTSSASDGGRWKVEEILGREETKGHI